MMKMKMMNKQWLLSLVLIVLVTVAPDARAQEANETAAPSADVTAMVSSAEETEMPTVVGSASILMAMDPNMDATMAVTSAETEMPTIEDTVLSTSATSTILMAMDATMAASIAETEMPTVDETMLSTSATSTILMAMDATMAASSAETEMPTVDETMLSTSATSTILMAMDATVAASSAETEMPTVEDTVLSTSAAITDEEVLMAGEKPEPLPWVQGDAVVVSVTVIPSGSDNEQRKLQNGTDETMAASMVELTNMSSMGELTNVSSTLGELTNVSSMVGELTNVSSILGELTNTSSPSMGESTNMPSMGESTNMPSMDGSSGGSYMTMPPTTSGSAMLSMDMSMEMSMGGSGSSSSASSSTMMPSLGDTVASSVVGSLFGSMEGTVEATIALPELSDAGECNSDTPCGLCMGDCDVDEDCEGDLLCYRRPGIDVSPVPGCSGEGFPGRDYCYQATPETLRLRGTPCSVADPCGACEGDCDADSECAPGLLCYERQFDENVEIPGCVGTGISGLDYCYVPITGARKFLRRRE